MGDEGRNSLPPEHALERALTPPTWTMTKVVAFLPGCFQVDPSYLGSCMLPNLQWVPKPKVHYLNMIVASASLL